MQTTCRRCKQSFEPAGLGPLGGYLVLEATLLVVVVAAVSADAWAGRLFALSLAGLVFWALWRNHRDREATLCPACETARGNDR
jgi:hypothetical protein